ncbi:hypothetical protein BDY21DRAFT_365633 [Lineolata rhizophorae]|uniref:DUF4396 domain-containing protein n=1 Tax=Lineolata rhizophorae TaxID=578093 RepID=A0A6A6NT94_9PEZI|nr:hypothetical protein BDY21DRAFT_365633 [Lineolata rhizophorae]
MAGSHSYDQPLALIIISSISIGIGAVFALGILIDIVLRRGWKSMMAIMIPVYVINALYLWPITVWVYAKYGRPSKPSPGGQVASHCGHGGGSAEKDKNMEEGKGAGAASSEKLHMTEGQHGGTGESSAHGNDHHRHSAMHDDNAHMQHGSEGHEHGNDLGHMQMDHSGGGGGHEMHHMHHGADRPMFATVTVAVCHCGAACVIGDIIGEWIVYSADVRIAGEHLYPAFLIDFAFAVAAGIVFQYFSIAPMSGDYGAGTIWRAAKADVLSLLCFEVGLFGWMAIFDAAIFDWRLRMNMVTYWWMMQIGMFLGHWTAVPVNWWLIKTGVKEPCA